LISFGLSNLLFPLLMVVTGFLSAQRPIEPELPPLAEQAAELFMVGLPGKTPAGNPDSPDWRHFVLFARNIGNDQELRRLTASLSASANRPVWIAVDQEGGPVTRVPSDPTAKLGQEQIVSAEQAFQVAFQRANHLRGLGITMVLSPVVDRSGGRHAGLRERAFAGNWGELGAAMVSGYQAGGVTPAVKHFPSYGDLPGDVERSIPHKNLSPEEIAIFRQALAGAPVLMVSPIIIDNIDPALPAPLSSKVVEFIRRELGFGGVLLTDDVEMRAVRRDYDPVEFAVSAVGAGMNLVMFSGSDKTVEGAYQALVRQAEQDLKLRRQIEESYRLLQKIN
jgi:beta-N-acetylhexosaminidase